MSSDYFALHNLFEPAGDPTKGHINALFMGCLIDTNN